MSKQPLANAVSTSQIGLPPLFPSNSTVCQPSLATIFGISGISRYTGTTGTMGAIMTSNTLATSTVPPTRSNRHTRRCAFYYKRYYKAFEILSQPLQDAMQCRNNPGQAPLFTKEEIEIYRDINQKLADMYNKRFDGYRRLVAEEKGQEHAPYTKINKHILKCVEL
jgi:hypothetical protein